MRLEERVADLEKRLECELHEKVEQIEGRLDGELVALGELVTLVNELQKTLLELKPFVAMQRQIQFRHVGFVMAVGLVLTAGWLRFS